MKIGCLIFTIVGVLTTLTRADMCIKKYSCTSCSQVKICRLTSSGLKETFELTCKGDKPYCDDISGSCTDIPNTNCADKGGFLCMQDGKYPDTASCQQYHVCKNDTSFTFQCPKSEVFDGYKCSSSKSCSNFNCNGKTNIKVPHPKNGNVFAYCLYNKALFVDRCSDGETLDSASQKCSPFEVTTEHRKPKNYQPLNEWQISEQLSI